MPKKFDADTKVVSAFPAGPRDISTAATTQGDWVKLSDYDSLMVVYSSDPGTANQDPTVSLRQARTNTGTAAKALAAGQWFATEHATALGDALRPVGQPGTFTEAAGEQATLARVEVTADQLDVSNRFDWVQVRVQRGGNTQGKLANAVYVLRGARYAEEVDEQVTALA